MDLAYDHVQAITSSMRPLDYYLRLSEALNALSRGEASWASLAAKYEVEDCSGRRYASNGRDLVTQLLVALASLKHGQPPMRPPVRRRSRSSRARARASRSRRRGTSV